MRLREFFNDFGRAQVEVRRSRKPYSRGESTEARIIRKIQMASVCTCSVGEITTKLVNRIKLVTPHIVRATNMRMIICFMIFLSACNLPNTRSVPLILPHRNFSCLSLPSTMHTDGAVQIFPLLQFPSGKLEKHAHSCRNVKERKEKLGWT